MPKKRGAKRGSAKNVLRLPDLDHSKASVLQSLGSVASKRTYAFARLAPATINLRLAAVRRLAYEAFDNGLLSPDLAAGNRVGRAPPRLSGKQLEG
jgi:hypothetical protein